MDELVKALRDAASSNRKHLTNTIRSEISSACEYQIRKLPNTVILNALRIRGRPSVRLAMWFPSGCGHVSLRARSPLF